ncbi:MAG: hypothetical protein R3C14_51600 [Caldilineaceae bacterium]
MIQKAVGVLEGTTDNQISPVNGHHVLPNNHLVLDGIPWHTYLQILQALDDRHLRITYDRGSLEL